MRCLGSQRPRRIAEHGAVERDIAAHHPLRPDQRRIIARIDRRGLGRQWLEGNLALILAKRTIALGMKRDRRAPVLLDLEPRHVDQPVAIAAVGRGPGVGARRRRSEALAKHHVHHPLVGRIAIFQRDFLGQYLDPLDRLWGQIADLLEARNALAVEQDDRPAAATTPRTARLGRDRRQQFGDAGRPGRANVAVRQYVLGRNVTDHRSARLLPGDDDVAAVLARIGGFTRGRLARRGRSARTGRRGRCPWRGRRVLRGGRHGQEEQAGRGKQSGADHDGQPMVVKEF